MSLTPATPASLQSGIPPLIALTMEAFMNMHLPERGFLLHPVIPAQGIVILFAPRGIGKTFTALSAALAVAGGATLFHWHAPNPKQVLYVDGEMPAQAMQDRLISLAIDTAMTQPCTLSSFTKKLEQAHVSVRMNTAKTGFISGISFSMDGVIFKGSSLGHQYTWGNLKKRGLYHEQDRYVVRSA